jgi:hypothetical protein
MANATASEGIIYVNSAAALNGDGQKWESAYNNIDDALTESVYIKWYAKDYKGTSIMPATTVQVWVATGRYPMRTNLYGVFDKVDIYGGFLGGEISVSDRVFDTNHLPAWPTTLLDNPWNVQYPPPYYSHVLSVRWGTNRFDGLRFEGAGGILQEGGNLTVANCIFTRVNPQTVSIGGNGIFSMNNATLTVERSYFLNGWASRGGAIAADNAASVTINNSTFSGNSTNGSGGAIWINGNQTSTSYPGANVTYGAARLTNVVMANNAFSNGYAVSNGGAISIENAGSVAIAGSKFNNNFSYMDGGALSVRNASGLEIIGSTFGSFENGIANPSKGNRADSGYGGAVYATSISGSLKVTSNNFYGNSSIAGGAVFSYAQDQNATILVSESTFAGNRADYGGAILDYAEITGAAKTVTLAITKNTFSNNIASTQGPAIYYDGTQMSVNGRDLTTRQFGSVDEKVIRKWLIQDNNYSLKDADIFAPL